MFWSAARAGVQEDESGSRSVSRWANFQQQEKKLLEDFANTQNLNLIVNGFFIWMKRVKMNEFPYSQIEGAVDATALTDAQGEPRAEFCSGQR